MNREQMIAWLCLEGWEPSIFQTNPEDGINNYAIRHPKQQAWCMDTAIPVCIVKDIRKLGMCRGQSSWWTESDKPGDWAVFTSEQLTQVVKGLECK